MAEFKNRIIRISNIPNDKVIYEVKSKPVLSFFVSCAIGVALLFTRFWMFGVFFLLISLYALFFLPNHVMMKFTDRFLVSFIEKNNQECTIIYWNEIVKWTYIVTRQTTDFIYVELNDGDRMNLPVMPQQKVQKLLRKYAEGKEERVIPVGRFLRR
jgi:hypothetical protein